MNVCVVCLKISTLRCTICNETEYCSLQCQQFDYFKHRNICLYSSHLHPNYMKYESFKDALNKYNSGNYLDSIDLFELIIQEVCHERNKEESMLTISCHKFIGKAFDKQANISKRNKNELNAIKSYENIARRSIVLLGTNNYEALKLVRSYCKILMKYRKYSEALCQLEWCLKLSNDHIGENHKFTIETQEDIGLVYKNLKEYNKSLIKYCNCLEKRNILLFVDDIYRTYEIMRQVASIQDKIDNEQYELLINSKTRNVYTDNDIIIIKHEIINLIKNNNEFNEVELMNIYLNLDSEYYITKIPYFHALLNLGNFYLNNKRYYESEQKLKQCEIVSLEIFDDEEDNINIQTVRYLLAGAYIGLGKYDVAKKIILTCIEQYNNKYFGDYPPLITLKSRLAEIYLKEVLQ